MATRLAVDGLWLCLRPSFSQPVAERLPNSLSYTTRAVPPVKRPFFLKSPRAPLSTTTPTQPSSQNADSPGSTAAGGQHPAPSHTDGTQRQQRVTEQFLAEKPVTNLENKLQDVVVRWPDYISACRIIRELIVVRGVKPATRHYKALMLANVDPVRGSPSQVRKLLKEMDKYGIVADSGVLHSALKALAIHPDYLLRQEVLQGLRERWISLSPSGWHNLVTGYLRERQYEMALKTLSHMEAQDVPVQDWLYGLFIYNLCDAEEFDEALRLMRRRLGRGYALSPNLWHRVLDLASDALHEEMVTFIWQRRVTTGYLIASYGVCNNSLTIAARSGNVDLATSVFQVLGDRKAPFSRNDYEALVDTYVAADDILSAFRVLCVMKNTGIGATESTTRPILTQFIWKQTKPLDAWGLLKQLAGEEQREIPTTAADVIVDLCSRQRDADAAMAIYRELHLICPDGPSTDTFNRFLGVCHRATRIDMGSFYVAEMRHFNILPNGLTYTHLLFLCLMESRYEDARNYFLEMAQSGFELFDSDRDSIHRIASKSRSDAARQFRVTLTVTQPTSRRVDPRAPRQGLERLNVLGQSSLAADDEEDAIASIDEALSPQAVAPAVDRDE